MKVFIDFNYFYSIIQKYIILYLGKFMRILIYESNTKIRESMMAILIMAGYDVVALREKKHILRTLGKRPFSIAVIDIEEDDGEMNNIIEAIYTDDRYKGINIIAHINETSKEIMTNLLEKGAIGFLLKPFNEKDFLARFNTIIDKANLKPKKLKYMTTKDFDNSELVFRDDKNNRILHATLTELSAVGLKFIPNDSGINLSGVIDNASIYIGPYTLNLSISITDKSGEEYSGNFTYVSLFNLKLICKLVHDKHLEKL